MPAELVIFDCDGVLVDSEPISNRVFAAKLAELGLAFSLEQMYERFMGRSMAQCVEIIAGLLGRALPADFVDELRERTNAALAAELKPVRGIVEALDRLALPYCVASSGDHDKMRTTLGITGLLPRFEGKLFSVTQVARGKPAPDVYLYAAKQTSIAPAACAVVEDTPTGVAAGVAAGMTVYGYCALMPAARLLQAGAHHVFTDMAMLPALINGKRPATRAAGG